LEPNQHPPSLLKFVIILFLVAFIFIGSIVFITDIQCNSDIETWVPLYPNAETVSVEYDFIRARAIGNTRLIQVSPDDVETVKQFYRDNLIELLNARRSRGLASTDWRIEPDEETGGSRIILLSACGT
jgi:predicted membrane protein